MTRNGAKSVSHLPSLFDLVPHASVSSTGLRRFKYYAALSFCTHRGRVSQTSLFCTDTGLHLRADLPGLIGEGKRKMTNQGAAEWPSLLRPLLLSDADVLMTKPQTRSTCLHLSRLSVRRLVGEVGRVGSRVRSRVGSQWTGRLHLARPPPV